MNFQCSLLSSLEWQLLDTTSNNEFDEYLNNSEPWVSNDSWPTLSPAWCTDRNIGESDLFPGSSVTSENGEADSKGSSPNDRQLLEQNNGSDGRFPCKICHKSFNLRGKLK
jgi:type II secretory pathway pseudopilin PulG